MRPGSVIGAVDVPDAASCAPQSSDNAGDRTHVMAIFFESLLRRHDPIASVRRESFNLLKNGVRNGASGRIFISSATAWTLRTFHEYVVLNLASSEIDRHDSAFQRLVRSAPDPFRDLDRRKCKRGLEARR